MEIRRQSRRERGSHGGFKDVHLEVSEAGVDEVSRLVESG